jgi:putative heme-binding domain-containing protein
MKWGPHGDIYLIDWHDQNPCHQTKPDDWDYERGRVYRIQLKDRKGGKPVDLWTMSDAELATMMFSTQDPYLYRSTLRLLGGKPKSDIKTAIATATLDPNREPLRMLRLVATNGDYEIDGVHFRESVNRPEFVELLVQSVRMVNGKPHPVTMIADIAETVGKFTDPRPRREVASLAVLLADNHDVSELVHALMKHTEDADDPLIPHLTWLAYEKVLMSSARPAPAKQAPVAVFPGSEEKPSTTLDDELAFLAEQAPGNIFVRDHIVPKVMRRLVATGKAEELALCVKFIRDVADLPTREKALGGLVLAMQGQTVDAPAGWAELQPKLRTDEKLAPLLDQLAVNFRDPEALKRAMTLFTDKSQASTTRTQALRNLVQLKAPDLGTLIEKTMQEETDLVVKQEAARQLGSVSDVSVGKRIIETWASYPEVLRTDIAASLASRKDTARFLLEALEAKTIARTELTDNTILRIQSFNDGELNRLIEKAWGRTRKTPDELNKLIDKTRTSLGAAPASYENGMKVFEAQCAKCHKFMGNGADVGPQLDGAGRDIEYLLGNILDPNRVIGAPYFVRTANLLDGQAVQGILTEEDDQFITLKVENGVLKKLKKADLDGPVSVAEKSIMPEGLSYGMSEQDFRDLVCYVMANRFITNVLIDDKPVSVPVTGRIDLPKAEDTNTVVLTATVSVSKALETSLILTGTGSFEVTWDGQPLELGTAKTNSTTGVTLPVKLSEGTHTLKVKVDYKGDTAVSLRFLDPDRVVSYPAPDSPK